MANKLEDLKFGVNKNGIQTFFNATKKIGGFNYRLIPRALKGFTRALVFKKSTLKIIELLVTHKCQLSCSWCSVINHERKHHMELTVEEIRQIAQRSKQIGNIAFNIYGGEPLIRKDLEDIIQAINPKDFIISMVSNGLLMTKDRLKSLHKAGCKHFAFSFESLDPTEENKLFGAPSHYEKVMEVIEWGKELDIEIGLLSLFEPGHIDRFEEVVKYALKRDILVGINELTYTSATAKSNSPLLSMEDNIYLRENILKKYPNVRTDWSLTYFLKPMCPAGKEKINIDPYGNVIPCLQIPIHFGNVREEDLSVIWRRMGRFSKFKNHYPGCLAADDKDYHENYVDPIIEMEVEPLFYRDHPTIQKELPTMDLEDEKYGCNVDGKSNCATCSS